MERLIWPVLGFSLWAAWNYGEVPEVDYELCAGAPPFVRMAIRRNGGVPIRVLFISAAMAATCHGAQL